jgi:hypothetical protein
MYELDGNQTRQFIDCQQVHLAARHAEREYAERYKGSMAWKTISNSVYLYRKREGIWKSLGPKSVETEKIYTQFHTGRDDVKAKCKSLQEKLRIMAPVNKAMRIGRVPWMSAKILRRIENLDVLGKGLMVVGTHALYAYELMGGVHFGQDAVATMDIDLLYDARGRLKLFCPELQKNGLIGVLNGIDSSFEPLSADSFRAANKDGFMVDLITPSTKNPSMRSFKSRISDDMNDLKAVEIDGLKWLENCPAITECAIDEKGYPLTITAPDPRAFVCHKMWLSQRMDRDPGKKRRDLLQAHEVTKMLNRYLPHLQFDDPCLNALPVDVRNAAMSLADNLRQA